MRFATDIVAVNLKEYGHSPQLLTDLGREGYELFDPTGYVFFRRHNRLASTPVTPTTAEPVTAAPEPESAPTTEPEPAPAIVGNQDGSAYLGDVPLHAEGGVAGQGVSTFLDQNPAAMDLNSLTVNEIDYGVLASRVYKELQKQQRSNPTLGLR